MSERLLGWVAGSFLLLQLALPIRQLARDRPARWGWQMFSAPPGLTEIRIVYPDSVASGPAGRFLTYHRREIQPSGEVADRLCEAHDGATEVRLVRKDQIRLARPCP